MSSMMSQRFQQDEAFIKAQLVAFCKALNKAEAPLKQKHVRALIVGTHRQRSARIFWHAVSRVQLEKNPVLTWKFCHLLHKLIRDGHRKVAEDSYSHCSRLVQLGNFWQHLRTSGYGQANTAYCKLLVSRLKFHKKYPSIPGSLQVTPNQLEALTTDMNETYEWAVDVLDQMDESLNLKTTVTGIMDSLRWSSLVPQGQCLLAPLIVVIIDSSKYYDFLVKALFKLHSALPPDTLIGHRERFYEMFRKTKKFYEEASSLQYFKYLVSLPTLPSVAPNFLHASDLDIYESPQAYLHNEQMSEAGETTPPDAQSLVSDEAISTIVDLSMPNMAGTSSSPGGEPAGNLDKRDEVIASLQHDLEMERETKEQLIQACHHIGEEMKEQLIHEARSRIGQYENRLVQMKQEIDLHKQAADERREELVVLRSSAENHQQQQQSAEELEKRVQDKEQKFAKMKTIYDNLREEHIKALTDIRELRASADENEAALRVKSDEMCQASTELQSKSVMLEAEVEELKDSIEALSRDHLTERERTAAEAAAQLKECRAAALGGVCAAAYAILEQGQEDLQNASSVSYPAHLAASALRVPLEQAENKLMTLVKQGAVSAPLLEANILFGHKLAEASVNCASAAYTASIQHFEPVNEQSRKVISASQHYFKSLGEATNWPEVEALLNGVKAELVEMEKLVKALPTSTGDVDLETVGSQLDEEMRMMDAAIQKAVAQIEQMQKNLREKDSGVRLEVNEKILDSCNSLMSAVRLLVSHSRDVQGEIVASGRGTASSNEFYKRNHLWTEGLLSASRAVGVAATVLVSSADGLISGKGKFEHLIVAAQEIGASVAQLFVSSRVKADKDSKKLAELGSASKSVNACTAEVVAAVRSGQQSLSDDKLLDFTHFTLHEAKTKEMESQVRTLELEAELQRERVKLASLRKQHYHLASLVAANKEGENGTG